MPNQLRNDRSQRISRVGAHDELRESARLLPPHDLLGRRSLAARQYRERVHRPHCRRIRIRWGRRRRRLMFTM